MSKSVINLLIVDDSVVVRTLLTQLFLQEEDINIIGSATDGAEACKKVAELQPDIILMDVVMPNMDGYEATKKIMRDNPVPIIILSSLVSDTEKVSTYNALEAGALAAFNKPVDIVREDFAERKLELLDAIRGLYMTSFTEKKVTSTRRLYTKSHLPKKIDILALGLSTGGPEVLSKVLSNIRADLPVPVVVVLHISKGFLEGLVGWLQQQTKLKVYIASHGQNLLPGCVYFAPDDFHLTVKKEVHPKAILLNDKPVNQFRPSITSLFESLAKSYPMTTVAGIFTGMGRDGAAGLAELSSKGAYVFVQSERTTVVPGMVVEAKKSCRVDEEIDLDLIATFINKLFESGRGE